MTEVILILAFIISLSSLRPSRIEEIRYQEASKVDRYFRTALKM